MPKPPPDQPGQLDFKEKVGYAYATACTLAVFTEPFAAKDFGKRYFGINVVIGICFLFVWIAYHPGHEVILTRFGMVWLAAVMVQMLLARWNHRFGRRQLTGYMGIPLVTFLLPLNIHFARRVVNPLLSYAVGSVIEDQALSHLIHLSAIGQAVACGFVYAMQGREDDARDDAALLVRNR